MWRIAIELGTDYIMFDLPLELQELPVLETQGIERVKARKERSSYLVWRAWNGAYGDIEFRDNLGFKYSVNMLTAYERTMDDWTWKRRDKRYWVCRYLGTSVSTLFVVLIYKTNLAQLVIISVDKIGIPVMIQSLVGSHDRLSTEPTVVKMCQMAAKLKIEARYLGMMMHVQMTR